MFEEISVKRLTVGMYVSLREIPWFSHPFLLSNFEIKNRRELRDIIGIGRATVLYDPQKSRSAPLPEDRAMEPEPPDSTGTAAKSRRKREKASELRARRARFNEVREKFGKGLNKSKWIFEGIKGAEPSAAADAKRLAEAFGNTFLDDVSLAIQHINMTATDAGQHFHSLNVMTLSLMLGKQLGLSAEDMNILSLGALLHDVGLLLLPGDIAISTKLSKSGWILFKRHPMIGVQMLSKLPGIDPQVMKIVYQHHEQCDGRGYPKGLKGDAIADMSKIVSIADVYDRLVNTRDVQLGLAPHKALSLMFAKRKAQFEGKYLETFIKMLGVYPPGTVCRFSSGDVGVVVSVNPANPLLPEVVIYDANIPKHDAMIYRLGEDIDLTITSTLNPGEIDQEIKGYLDSRSLVQYFPNR
ncbi:HD domain-containing phosphohydrolase [Desulfovibrio sp. Huiquan2017]|uniref:HD-GYP domain-containing protein n=1 Tax=Desulfovibrio sp. Huiquan2017 TaxID=2816861 RepID=UPI001A9315AA|nr:HD domain-containing phosphohydrolase [Desulfovibrio sp. Huiquan2017]